jgi:hypothetical protein
MLCPICQSAATLLRAVDDVPYFRCDGCGSVFAHPDFLAGVESGVASKYAGRYWRSELGSARKRSFSVGVVRVAEVVRLSRIPLMRMLDIGAGAGFLLDALQDLVPSLASHMHGVELYPPAEDERSRHPNYAIGSILGLKGCFDGGVCIEVIEHLTPNALSGMVSQLSERSSPGAIYFFNSGQPSYVERFDPAYLDPHRRGHVVAWSIAGARKIFEPAGFNVIPLPGRDWAFLAERGPPRDIDSQALLSWLWNPIPANVAITGDDPFGGLFQTIGVESARCYLEAGVAEERTLWALALQQELSNRDDL